MKILDRYIYTKLSVYLLIIFPSFSIISEFVELIELFRKVKNPEPNLMLTYIVSKLPENSYYILPVSLLVSVFIVIVDLKKSREIYPILTSGISVWYINSRFIIASVVVSILQIINIQTIMPHTVKLSQQTYQRLKNQQEEEQKTLAYNLWLKISHNTFLYFDVYDSSSKSGKGLIITQFDDSLKPVKRVEAKEFNIKDGKVTLRDYKKIEINSLNDVKIETSQNQTEVQTKIDENELTRLIIQKKPVSLTQVYKVAQIAKKYGYEPSYYWTKFFQKATTVISPFVLLVFAVNFFWQKEYYRIFIGFISILVYWYSIAVISSITESGKIPYLFIPAVDFVFLMVGIFLLRKKNLSL